MQPLKLPSLKTSFSGLQVASSPRSPRKSPKPARESSTEEKAITNYISGNFPILFTLIEKGQSSRFLTLIEQIFYLHTTVQCNCLPVTNRNICVQTFIKDKTEKNAKSMGKLYDEWEQKESQALNAATENRDLTDREAAIIQAVRDTTFELMYQEQEKLASVDPFQPFLSIFGADGTRNLGYVDTAHAFCEPKALLTQKQLQNFHTYFVDFLGLRQMGYEKCTQQERNFLEQGQKAGFEALIKCLRDGPCTFHDDTVLLMGAVASKPTVQYLQDLVASNVAEQEWALYSEKWEGIFGVKFGFAFKSLSPSEVQFLESIRAVYYRLIYEEQKPGLPFVSICNRKGECNENYWIDLLNAQSRARKEKPFTDHRDLKDFSDFDVVSVNTAPYIPQEGSIQDTTGIRREDGSIIKDFCMEVLLSMKEYAESVESRSITPTHAVKQLFENPALSHTDLLHYIQNQFCQSLAETHYVRGLTHTLLKKLNISYTPTSPRLLATPRQAIDPFESDCALLLAELQQAEKLSKQECTVDGVDEAVGIQFSTYSHGVSRMRTELEKLGITLQLFAERLTSDSQQYQKPKKAGSYRGRSSSKPQKLSAEEPLTTQQQSTRARSQSVLEPPKAPPPTQKDASTENFEEMAGRIAKVVETLKQVETLLNAEAQPFAFDGLKIH